MDLTSDVLPNLCILFNHTTTWVIMVKFGLDIDLKSVLCEIHRTGR